MNKFNKEVFFGTIYSYATMFLDVFFGLLITPLIINFLGESKYGLLTLSNSIIVLFTMDFGLSQATTKYISIYRANADTEKIRSFIGIIYKFYFFLDLILFCIFSFVYFNLSSIYTSLNIQEINIFKIIFIFTAVSSLISFPCINFNGILLSHENIFVVKFSEFIYRIIRVIGIFIVIKCNLNIFIFFAIYSFTNIIAIVIKFYWISIKLKIKPDFKNTKGIKIRNILTFSFWITVAMLAQRLVISITPSILGRYSSSSFIAIFGIASMLEGYVYTFCTALNGLFMPKISKIIYSKSDIEPKGSLDRLLSYVGRYNFCVNFLIVLVFFIVGKDFIFLWLGKEFELSYFCTILLITPAMFYNALQIAHSTVLILDKPYIPGIVDSIVGITNLILSIILTKKFGVIGSCISIFSVVVLRVLVLHIIYSKILDVNIHAFIFNCYIKMIPVFIVVLGIGFLLNNIFKDINWINFMIKASICSIVYIILSCFVYFSNEDRKKLRFLCKLSEKRETE